MGQLLEQTLIQNDQNCLLIPQTVRTDRHRLFSPCHFQLNSQAGHQHLKAQLHYHSEKAHNKVFGHSDTFDSVFTEFDVQNVREQGDKLGRR